jgi:hypothetical protein
MVLIKKYYLLFLANSSCSSSHKETAIFLSYGVNALRLCHIYIYNTTLLVFAIVLLLLGSFSRDEKLI